jgi:hypothetical protein
VQSRNDFMQTLDASHATMQEIAEATGGHAFINGNGIALAAGKAISEGSAYYTLVYAPSNLNFDGGLRTIHVKLNRPGCKLAYRSAYYAVDPATVTAEDAESGALARLMVHGAPDAQGLVFKAMIDPDGQRRTRHWRTKLSITRSRNRRSRSTFQGWCRLSAFAWRF